MKLISQEQLHLRGLRVLLQGNESQMEGFRAGRGTMEEVMGPLVTLQRWLPQSLIQKVCLACMVGFN